jgi:hypothetical protein
MVFFVGGLIPEYCSDVKFMSYDIFFERLFEQEGNF